MIAVKPCSSQFIRNGTLYIRFLLFEIDFFSKKENFRLQSIPGRTLNLGQPLVGLVQKLTVNFGVVVIQFLYSY